MKPAQNVHLTPAQWAVHKKQWRAFERWETKQNQSVSFRAALRWAGEALELYASFNPRFVKPARKSDYAGIRLLKNALRKISSPI